MVEWLFLAVPWSCLRFVIVVFPDHTHLLFLLVMRTLPSFFLNMFIFGTIMAYGVQITKDYSDHWIGLGAQGQGQLYLNLSAVCDCGIS